MSEEEFKEKLVKLVLKYIRTSDEGLEDSVDLTYEFDFMNSKYDLEGEITFSFCTTEILKEHGYL